MRPPSLYHDATTTPTTTTHRTHFADVIIVLFKPFQGKIVVCGICGQKCKLLLFIGDYVVVVYMWVLLFIGECVVDVYRWVCCCCLQVSVLLMFTGVLLLKGECVVDVYRGVFQVAGFVKTLSCLTLKTGKLRGFRSRKRGNETFW